MSRVSPLDRNPEYKDILAQMLGNGIPYRIIAEHFDVHLDTVGVWKKRPDIQALVTKYIQERANAILAHTDTAIQKRLEQSSQPGGKPIPVEVLLRIRQTYAADRPPEDAGDEKPAALEEMLLALHTNPDLAKQLGFEAKPDDD